MAKEAEFVLRRVQIGRQRVTDGQMTERVNERAGEEPQDENRGRSTH